MKEDEIDRFLIKIKKETKKKKDDEIDRLKKDYT
jgi:hypothetical protein